MRKHLNRSRSGVDAISYSIVQRIVVRLVMSTRSWYDFSKLVISWLVNGNLDSLVLYTTHPDPLCIMDPINVRAECQEELLVILMVSLPPIFAISIYSVWQGGVSREGGFTIDNQEQSRQSLISMCLLQYSSSSSAKSICWAKLWVEIDYLKSSDIKFDSFP